jgi:hypothetical protein
MEKTTVNLPQIVNEKQAAQILAVSIAALRRWRRERRGPPYVKLERSIRYSVTSLEQFLTENSFGNKKAADSPSAAQAEVRDGHAALRP